MTQQVSDVLQKQEGDVLGIAVAMPGPFLEQDNKESNPPVENPIKIILEWILLMAQYPLCKESYQSLWLTYCIFWGAVPWPFNLTTYIENPKLFKISLAFWEEQMAL